MHVARMSRREMNIRFWRESQKERDHSEDQDIKMDLGGIV
jgi:hypothetical protein